MLIFKNNRFSFNKKRKLVYSWYWIILERKVEKGCAEPGMFEWIELWSRWRSFQSVHRTPTVTNKPVDLRASDQENLISLIGYSRMKKNT